MKDTTAVDETAVDALRADLDRLIEQLRVLDAKLTAQRLVLLGGTDSAVPARPRLQLVHGSGRRRTARRGKLHAVETVGGAR